jgi:hypothetical protein
MEEALAAAIECWSSKKITGRWSDVNKNWGWKGVFWLNGFLADQVRGSRNR